MDFILYGFAIIKYVIYGSSIFFTSRLTQNVDVLDIVALRFLMSFTVMLILKATKIIKTDFSVLDLFKPQKKHSVLLSLVLTALFEPVLYMTFETIGVSMTTNITASVVFSLLPAACAVSEFIFLKEKINPKKALFLAIGTAGVIYIAANTQSKGGTDTVTGFVFLVLAVIVGALYMTFSRKTSAEYSAMSITYFSSFMGAVVFNPINIVRHIINGNLNAYFTPFMNIDNLIGFVFLAIISTIIATGMNNFALARMQVSTMSAFAGLSTFVAIAIGILFNNEKLYQYHIIGISLILIRVIGIMILTVGDNKKIAEANDKKRHNITKGGKLK